MNLKIVLILSFSHLFVDVTGTALPAMMPFLKDSLHLSYTAVGMVIMVSNLTSSIIQPAFGYLSDKVEMKGAAPPFFHPDLCRLFPGRSGPLVHDPIDPCHPERRGGSGLSS